MTRFTRISPYFSTKLHYFEINQISCLIHKYLHIYISKLESFKNKCKILFYLKIIALIHQYHELFMSVLISLIFPYLIFR